MCDKIFISVLPKRIIRTAIPVCGFETLPSTTAYMSSTVDLIISWGILGRALIASGLDPVSFEGGCLEGSVVV